MVRQCAWCLHLINGQGEPISPAPLPKLYEASHGICCVCGQRWMEKAIESDKQQDNNVQPATPKKPLRKSKIATPEAPEEGSTAPIPGDRAECVPSITQLVLELQQPDSRRKSGNASSSRIRRKQTGVL